MFYEFYISLGYGRYVQKKTIGLSAELLVCLLFVHVSNIQQQITENFEIWFIYSVFTIVVFVWRMR